MNTKFLEFVEWAGGPEQAAKKIGKSESLVRHILNGRRNVTRPVANAAHAVSGGRFDRADLIFGDDAAA